MAVGLVDGEPAIVTLLRDGQGWTPRSLVHLAIETGRIIGVRDYTHCPWMIPAATSFHVSLNGVEP